MALWYLHRAEEPGLLPLDVEAFRRAVIARFPRARVASGDDETRVDIHLDAAAVACAVREVLTDEVTLRWVYEGGTPSTPVLSGDTPADVLARSRGL